MSKSSKFKAFAAVALILGAAVLAYVINRGPNGAAATTTGPASWSTETRAWVQKRRDKANELLRQNDFTQAQAVLAELIREHDDDPVAHALMVQVHMTTGDTAEAYKSAVRSLQIDGEQPDLLLAAGKIAERQGALEPAEQHYADAAKLQPDQAQPLMYLANVRLKMNKLDEAQLDALRTIELDRTVHQAYRILAEIAAKKGQTEQAITQIDTALSLVEPMTLDTLQYTLRKAAFLRRSGPAGREEALNILMALPKNMHGTRVEIAEAMALTYMSLNRPEDAAGVWEFWFTAHSYDARAAAEAGLAHHRAGNAELAQRWFDKARSLKPHLPQVRALALALGEPTE